jgi:ketosteroid isomerase-like protein
MMRLIAIWSAGLAILLTLASPVWAHEPAGSATQRQALPASAHSAAATVDAFHAALQRGDTRSAAALLAEDALIFEEGGAERSKAEYAAHHLPADAAFSKVVHSNIVRRSGGSSGALGWIATEGRMSGTYKGESVDRVTTETMLLRRVGQGWKIVHIHWSSGPVS